MEKANLMELQKQWQRLASCLSAENVEYWETLVAYYSQNGLAYHNLHHIADCLEKFQNYQDLAENKEAIEWAIWFHDIIYDPQKGDNEEASAEVARDFLAKSPQRELVLELILDTEYNREPRTSDGKLLCDIDLSILGSSSTVYENYSAAIRKEYAWVSDDDYRKGRSEVLRGFLKRKSIYRTSALAEKFEETARQNLTAEIKNLTL